MLFQLNVNVIHRVVLMCARTYISVDLISSVDLVKRCSTVVEWKHKSCLFKPLWPSDVTRPHINDKLIHHSLLPTRHQAITWIDTYLLSNGPHWINSREIKYPIFIRANALEIFTGKSQPFCLGPNVLYIYIYNSFSSQIAFAILCA